jgi:hypothetical protein
MEWVFKRRVCLDFGILHGITDRFFQFVVHDKNRNKYALQRSATQKSKNREGKNSYCLLFFMLILILIAAIPESNPTSAIIPIGVMAGTGAGAGVGVIIM